jgi:hypothetical protein
MLNLLDLPTEVLEVICSFSTNTLKDLRLTNSRLLLASTPPLFRNIVIVPHATSFANMLALSQSPLARHVHEIVYDVRTLSSIADIKMAFEANEFAFAGSSFHVLPKKEVFALLDDYAKQAFISVKMTEVEIEHLLKALPCLTNLKHITMTSGSLCSLPYFYSKLKSSLSITSDYYFETSNRSGHHARSVLLCQGALNLNIPSLSFIGVDWAELVLFRELRTPAWYLTTLQRVFRRLPKEDLPLPMFLFLYASQPDDREASLEDLLPVLATVLDNVQHLKLSMATSRSERQLFLPTGPAYPLSLGTECASLSWVIECMRSIGQVGPGNLRSLTLTSIVLEKEDLEFFLDGCRDSLIEVSIGDARIYSTTREIVANGQGSVEESCLVKLLELIFRKCHLRSVSLFGRFYNGGSQDWLLDPRGTGALKADVERWIVNGGDCPLNSERIADGVQGTRAGDSSFNIFRRTLGDGADELDYEFPPTSENELLGAW